MDGNYGWPHSNINVNNKCGSRDFIFKYIPNGVGWICDPLRTYSLSQIGVMRSSSNKSCHTYPVLYLLPFNNSQLQIDFRHRQTVKSCGKEKKNKSGREMDISKEGMLQPLVGPSKSFRQVFSSQFPKPSLNIF